MTEAGVVYETKSVSLEALATLGEGQLAYVKQIRSEDVPGLFPQAPRIAPGLKLFALHAADGTPIMLTDSREQRSRTPGATNCRPSASIKRAAKHGIVVAKRGRASSILSGTRPAYFIDTCRFTASVL